MTSNTTNSPQQIAPPWCPWHARRTTCCRCRPDIHVAPSPLSDTREAVALADAIHSAVHDWARHADDPEFLAAWETLGFQYSESNIEKVHIGWRMAQAVARSTPNAGTEMLLREARGALNAAVEYMRARSTNSSQPFPLARAEGALAKIDASQSPTGDER